MDRDKLMRTGQNKRCYQSSRYWIKTNIRNLNINIIKFDWKYTEIELGMKYNKRDFKREKNGYWTNERFHPKNYKKIEF